MEYKETKNIGGIDPTQQFALAGVYPRSIAWLVKQDDWNLLEEIVNYNCAMLGGYFNVIIPVNSEGEISKEYIRFIINYDPDIIILSRGVPSIKNKLLNPFKIISWELISQIATTDPWDFRSGLNSTLRGLDNDFSKKPVFAIADDAHPDTSRFAFFACGDVKSGGDPSHPLSRIMRKLDQLDRSGSGYREQILAKFLNQECDPKALEYHVKNGIFIPSPDRHKLKNMILEDYQFPLSGAVEILDTCCRMQNLFNSQLWSFISFTASYSKGNNHRLPYNMVILISEKFSQEEAILFWNLRAQEVYVAWVPFSVFIEDKDSVLSWLTDIFGGALFVDRARFNSSNINLAFSSPNCDIERLQGIFKYLESGKKKYSTWEIINYDDLVFYSYIRPPISQEQIMVAQNASICTFLPKLSQEELNGTLIVQLEWDELMLPQINELASLISSETIQGNDEDYKCKISMPRFRIGKNRFIKIQIMNKSNINFIRPSSEQIFRAFFLSKGFSKIAPSDKARYQTDFINKCSDDLDIAFNYLAASPYRDFFELLSNNKKNEKKLGWILDHPDKRRVLNHLQLREIFKETTPVGTEEYFNTIADELPEEVIKLFKKGLVERGIKLKCDSCSFVSWYPAEDLGQGFKCNRCYKSQVCTSNPLWLYKLPEVTYQGFFNNMEVPLLALNYLKKMSKHYFEWIPDLDVWYDNKPSNIDIACIVDGKLFLGEAKIGDDIEKRQFEFYKNLCERISPDGIVFATSKVKWNPSTIGFIEKLKNNFGGEIIILTCEDLYSLK